jgi:hypothetical protein
MLIQPIKYLNSPIRSAVICTILILSFLIIELSYVKFPGPVCDEAGLGNEAIAIKEGGRITLMRDLHNGALDLYVLTLVYQIFPSGIVSMRLMAIFFGCLTILLTYLFTASLFNRGCGLLAAFLLTINPGFVMGTKLGADYGTIMLAIYLCVLILLLEWYRTEKTFNFCLAMFLLGLGMWTRVWFIWFIFGLFCTAAVFFRMLSEKLKLNTAKRFLKYAFLGTVFFSLGCSVIIYHEWTTGFASAKYIVTSFLNPSINIGKHFDTQHNNFHYFYNIMTVLGNLRDVLTGRFFFFAQFREAGRTFIDRFYLWVFLFSIVCLVISGSRKDFSFRRKPFFLLSLFFGMLVITPFSPFYLPSHHLYIFFPLAQIIIAVAIIAAYEYFRKIKPGVFLVIICACLLTAAGISGLERYFYYLKKSGGKQYYSPVIYDLANYLLKADAPRVFVGSYGLYDIISMCSGGRIIPVDLISVDPEAIISLPKNSNDLYVFYHRDLTASWNNLREFLKTAQTLHFDIIKEKEFYERDGSPLYLVYKIAGKKAL